MINCFDISSITKAARSGECLMPVNHFKVEPFCRFSIKHQTALDQYNLMVPQIVLRGWEGERQRRCKAGLSDEFLLLQGGDKRHKELPSQRHPSSLSVFSVIYNGWRCCCVTKGIQQRCVCGSGCERSSLSICVGSFWFLLVYLLICATTCIPSGWTCVFDVAPVICIFQSSYHFWFEQLMIKAKRMKGSRWYLFNQSFKL